MELRDLPVSFPTKKRLCYLLEGLRRIVEVRRPEEIPAARAFAEGWRLPHADTAVEGYGSVLVLARDRVALESTLRLRREWNALARDPDEIARELARVKFRIPEKAVNEFGHTSPLHLVHAGHATQEVLDFQPTGLAEREVRREMDLRMRALAKHRLL